MKMKDQITREDFEQGLAQMLEAQRHMYLLRYCTIVNAEGRFKLRSGYCTAVQYGPDGRFLYTIVPARAKGNGARWLHDDAFDVHYKDVLWRHEFK